MEEVSAVGAGPVRVCSAQRCLPTGRKQPNDALAGTLSAARERTRRHQLRRACSILRLVREKTREHVLVPGHAYCNLYTQVQSVETVN